MHKYDWHNKLLKDFFLFFSVRICTQKAQQDLRYEEDIDAFSMNGDAGRTSPTLRQTDDDNGTINGDIYLFIFTIFEILYM